MTGCKVLVYLLVGFTALASAQQYYGGGYDYGETIRQITKLTGIAKNLSWVSSGWGRSFNRNPYTGMQDMQQRRVDSGRPPPPGIWRLLLKQKDEVNITLRICPRLP